MGIFLVLPPGLLLSCEPLLMLQMMERETGGICHAWCRRSRTQDLAQVAGQAKHALVCKPEVALHRVDHLDEAARANTAGEIQHCQSRRFQSCMHAPGCRVGQVLMKCLKMAQGGAGGVITWAPLHGPGLQLDQERGGESGALQGMLGVGRPDRGQHYQAGACCIAQDGSWGRRA